MSKAYKVNDKHFNTFIEVATYAWNEYRIEFDPYDLYGSPLTEDIKQEACLELQLYINHLESDHV